MNQNHLQATVLNVPLLVTTRQTSAYDNNISCQLGNKMPTCRTGHNSGPHSAATRQVPNRPTPRLRSTTLTQSDHNNVERHYFTQTLKHIAVNQRADCSAVRQLTHEPIIRSTHAEVVNLVSTATISSYSIGSISRYTERSNDSAGIHKATYICMTLNRLWRLETRSWAEHKSGVTSTPHVTRSSLARPRLMHMHRLSDVGRP